MKMMLKALLTTSILVTHNSFANGIEEGVVNFAFGEDMSLPQNTSFILKSDIPVLNERNYDIFCIVREVKGKLSEAGCTTPDATDSSIAKHNLISESGYWALQVDNFSVDKAIYRLQIHSTGKELVHSIVTSIECSEYPTVIQVNALSNRRTLTTCGSIDMIHYMVLEKEQDGIIIDYSRSNGQLLVDEEYSHKNNDATLLVVNGNWYLVANSCQLHDIFSVRITTKEGTTINDFRLDFEVTTFDTLSIEIQATRRNFENGQSELRCLTDKAPKKISFLKSGKIIEGTDHFNVDEQNGILLINNITSKDEGNYTCRAITECSIFESSQYSLKVDKGNDECNCRSQPNDVECPSDQSSPTVPIEEVKMHTDCSGKSAVIAVLGVLLFIFGLFGLIFVLKYRNITRRLAYQMQRRASVELDEVATTNLPNNQQNGSYHVVNSNENR
ncbi:uncharacterized protein LOC144453303 [Glandiceps talaboti]